MRKNLQDWVQQLKGVDLPVLRRTAREFDRLSLRADRVTASEIAAVALHDPLMTLKILRLANGLSRGRFRHEITTIEHAVMMVGISPFFKHMAQLSAIEDHLAGKGAALQGLRNAMSRAHHAAWQARDWAILRSDIKAEEVYIGALLHHMGEMLLWCFAPEQAVHIERVSRQLRLGMDDAQQEVLGFGLREFQLALANAWNLPETLSMFLDNENAVRPRVLGVVIAASIARHAATGWQGPQLMADYEVVAGLLHTSLDDAIALIHHNAVVESRHWQWYEVPPAATWLPMLPGPWPAEEPSETMAGGVTPPEKLKRISDRIEAHRENPLGLNELIGLALKGMHEGLGLRRAAFAVFTEDRNVFKAKYLLGVDPASPLRNFQFDVRQPHLFGRLMAKMQSVWLNDGNRSAVQPLLPPEVRRYLGEGEFFAMSVLVNDRPVGLFYADDFPDGKLTEGRYLEFKKLCLRAAHALAASAGRKKQ
jgi:HD-like signal output (HDOD) protein